MRIRELMLHGYRVHADPPPFKFADRFTVIAGINGKGKTALLDQMGQRIPAWQRDREARFGFDTAIQYLSPRPGNGLPHGGKV